MQSKQTEYSSCVLAFVILFEDISVSSSGLQDRLTWMMFSYFTPLPRKIVEGCLTQSSFRSFKFCQICIQESYYYSMLHNLHIWQTWQAINTGHRDRRMATMISVLPPTRLPHVWLCRDARAEKIPGLEILCKPITEAYTSIDPY